MFWHKAQLSPEQPHRLTGRELRDYLDRVADELRDGHGFDELESVEVCLKHGGRVWLCCRRGIVPQVAATSIVNTAHEQLRRASE